MFGGLGQPFINIRANRFGPGPVLIFMQIGRIDHAGDMAGPGEHELRRAAEIFRTVQHRFGRRDVILSGGEIVNRNLDLAQVESEAAQGQIRSFERSMLNTVAIFEASRKPCSCILRSSVETCSSSMKTLRSPAKVKSTYEVKKIADSTWFFFFAAR